jgi:glycoside/pentoside/hexuronide:cation symporter, GPH family
MKAAQGWRYGLLGLPLAFAALPLYVQLPAYYAREFGMPLASLGILLLVARLADGFVDPWIGRWTDARFARSPLAVLGAGAVAALLLALGMAALFLPPVRGEAELLAWAGLSLGVTYLAYSVLTVMHQSWGAMLGGDEAQRARITGWREALGLAGVLLASVAPTLIGWRATLALLAVALATGWLAWSRSPQPAVRAQFKAGSWRMPFQHRGFRKLLAVYMLNGIATAVPATLLLFFVRDLLQSSEAAEPIYLGTYFLLAACSIPLWLTLVRRVGLARSWLAGMGLSVAAFVWAAALGPGDTAAFIAICALCGIALGADLALPGALLAGLIESVGERGRGEGIFFGWWNAATKLNLALAAGMALPLLSFAGYAPGLRAPEALQALTLAYCILPCILKSAAAALLYLTLIRKEPPHDS